MQHKCRKGLAVPYNQLESFLYGAYRERKKAFRRKHFKIGFKYGIEIEIHFLLLMIYLAIGIYRQIAMLIGKFEKLQEMFLYLM